jgi:lysophospholipase L1-like esterase
MRRFTLAAVLAFLLVGGVAAPAAAGPGRSQVHEPPVYLALGDSVAAGVGAQAGAGYVPLLGALLETGYNPAANKATPNKSVDFGVVNLALGGATTATLIQNQLPAALALIEERRSDRDPRNDVEVITLTIGGNDVFTPVVGACLLDPTPTDCQQVVDTALGAAEAGITGVLRELVDVAGRRAEVVVTTYYNPIAQCSLAANPAAVRVADAVLEGGALPGLVAVGDGLNDRIRRAAATAGAQVTDLYGALGPGQFVGGPDCLHPNAAGHAEIAQLVHGTLAR